VGRPRSVWRKISGRNGRSPPTVCSRLKIHIHTQSGHFAFLTPKGQRTLFIAHWKSRVVDFLLVTIELFFAGSYGLGATSECRVEVGVSEGWPDSLFQSFKTNDRSFIWCKNLVRSFFNFVINNNTIQYKYNTIQKKIYRAL